MIPCTFPNLASNQEIIDKERVESMNEFLTIKSNEKANILAGPDCSLSNYEYRGDFLRGSDKKHFGPKVLHSKSWGLTNGW